MCYDFVLTIFVNDKDNVDDDAASLFSCTSNTAESWERMMGEFCLEDYE